MKMYMIQSIHVYDLDDMGLTANIIVFGRFAFIYDENHSLIL